MKKLLLLIPSIMIFTTAAIAQGGDNAGASQAAVLKLNNGIDIAYTTTGSGTGEDAVMNFTGPNDYSNGVMSAEQQMRVRSNNTFKVAVRCDGSSFAYNGASDNVPQHMPNDMLWMKVTGNNTGGDVRAPFSTSNFASITTNSQDLLVGGNRGGNQTFSVMYKCTPGFNLPAGTYSMNVVFTATQQ